MLLPYKPGYALIRCPNCGERSYMNEECLGGPPELNVNKCLKCFTMVRLLSLEPLVVGVIPGSGGPIEG